MRSFKQFLTEDFQGGKTLIFYHRTGLGGQSGTFRADSLVKKDPKNVEEFAKKFTVEFKVGKGDMYGPGVYGYSDLHSALNADSTRTYGNLIIKCKVNLDDILILDQNMAKRVLSRLHKSQDKDYYTIEGQLRNRGIKLSKDLLDVVRHMDGRINAYNKVYNKPRIYTAEEARALVKHLPINKGIVKGIAYTGKFDKAAIVVYDPKLITAMSYNTTFNKKNTLDNEQWTKITSLEQVKTSLKQRLVSQTHPAKKDFSEYTNAKDIIEKITDLASLDNLASKENGLYKLWNMLIDISGASGFFELLTSFLKKPKGPLHEFKKLGYISVGEINQVKDFVSKNVPSSLLKKALDELDMKSSTGIIHFIPNEYMDNYSSLFFLLPNEYFDKFDSLKNIRLLTTGNFKKSLIDLFKHPSFNVSDKTFLAISTWSIGTNGGGTPELFFLDLLKNKNFPKDKFIQMINYDESKHSFGYQYKNFHDLINYFFSKNNDAYKQTAYKLFETMLELGNGMDSGGHISEVLDITDFTDFAIKKLAATIDKKNYKDIFKKLTVYAFSIGSTKVNIPLRLARKSVLSNLRPSQIIDFLSEIKDDKVKGVYFSHILAMRKQLKLKVADAKKFYEISINNLTPSEKRIYTEAKDEIDKVLKDPYYNEREKLGNANKKAASYINKKPALYFLALLYIKLHFSDSNDEYLKYPN